MNLNKKIIKNIPTPVPTLSEQHQIVREIESRLSVCDKVEQNIAEALEKSEALRQSILKKAFEGKLLSPAEIEACRREADYEPASALLERIRKERPSGK
jgi:type I restriction enzyme S subunit